MLPPHACNDLNYWGTEDRTWSAAHRAVEVSRAPSLGRGVTEEEPGDSDSS